MKNIQSIGMYSIVIFLIILLFLTGSSFNIIGFSLYVFIFFLPLIIALLLTKKFFQSEHKKNIHKLPLLVFKIAFTVSFLIEIYLILFQPEGGQISGLYSIVWPVIAIGYMLTLTGLSYITSKLIYKGLEEKKNI